MAKTIYRAIVFMQDPNAPVRKYRNAYNDIKFYNFCESIGAAYYNLYDKTTKLFVERIYIKKGQ